MRNLLTLLILFITVGLSAQLVFSPEDPIGVGHDEMEEVQVDISVTNMGTEEVTFFWQIDVLDGPDDWQVVVCDNNLCYAPGVLACPCASPNVLGGGATMTFMVKIKPKQTQGTGTLQLNVTTDCDGADVLFETPIDYEVNMFSNVDNIQASDIAVYPNPTSDYFQVSNDNLVSKVALYSIVGKQIYSYEHEMGQAYSLTNIDAGVYLVRAFDNNGKIIKAMRLSKR